MINRARAIAQMMGYESIDEILEAIGEGELIMLKVPESARQRLGDWLHEQAAALENDEALSEALSDLANGIDLAHELERYPSGADVCDIDLPHGWPSYCDKNRLNE
jgi:hypothetical protein